MGFFDDIIKNVDKGLKAVESGALEKKLENVANVVEAHSQKIDNALDKVAGQPDKLLKAAESVKDKVEEQAHKIGDSLKD